MTSNFKFSFSGDDIEDSEEDSLPTLDNNVPSNPVSRSDASPPAYHALSELSAKLPEHISYSVLSIPITPTKSIAILRRELFDVRMQLMAEDTGSLSVAFTDEDIQTNLYEGGLKSWECSVDLVQELASMEIKEKRFIELGCGTALPSLYIFKSVLKGCLSGSSAETKYHFTFADYNYDVLRLVTLPNLLLNYLSLTRPTFAESSEIDFSMDIISEFTKALEDHHISIDFVSGSWSNAMSGLLHEHNPQGYQLVLASETIYSPSTVPAFVQILKSCLETGGHEKKRRGLIAAKTIYFGVGGNVQDFKQQLEDSGCSWHVLTSTKSTGVERLVGQVTIA